MKKPCARIRTTATWPRGTSWPRSITISAAATTTPASSARSTSLDQREAMALYGEVLSKIQSHYVSEPDWAALVRRGTAGLEVALGEAAFARQAG